MLEARLAQASIFKRLLDAIKELVTDANFDCSESGISLQAMDNSHVALVSLSLAPDAFEGEFRCDRNMPLGVNLNSLSKILRTAANDDTMTIRADDRADTMSLVFEAKDEDRIAEYDMKLMDIDQEHLGIPETSYDAVVRMPCADFQRICRDLQGISESVRIDVTKEGVKFSAEGEVGKGSQTLKQGGAISEEKGIEIELQQAVSLSFSLKYLVNFSKATPLCQKVSLNLMNEVPLLVEYSWGTGTLRYYLAPKFGDES